MEFDLEKCIVVMEVVPLLVTPSGELKGVIRSPSGKGHAGANIYKCAPMNASKMVSFIENQKEGPLVIKSKKENETRKNTSVDSRNATKI